MTATLDIAAVRQWLRILHADSPGLIHICATGLWKGATFPADQLDDAAAYTASLDAAGREGIYTRITTLKAALPPGTRGGQADTLALPALWADIDIAGPGHKNTGQLPPDEAAAQKIVEASNLPEPTLWIHSGGGLYPIWLLNQPHIVGDDPTEAAELTSGWQKAISHSATTLGWHYGSGVGDLARVLRIPGTVNRKEGLARPCRIISATAARYTYDDLWRYLVDALANIEPEPAPRLQSVRTDDGSISPGDDYAERTDWADILEPAGWRYAYTHGQIRYWRRPGKDTAGISATTNALGTDRLHIFTTSTQFEVGSHSKLGAYAMLHHGGDMRAAARKLQTSGYGQPASLMPNPAITQRQTISALIPWAPASSNGNVLSAVDGTAARIIKEPLPSPDKFGQTEDGMALALVAYHGHQLRYCPQRGSWLTWNGHVWAWDSGEAHREMIRQLARELPDDKEWRNFKRRCMSAAGVGAIARLAQTDAKIVTAFADLDSNPWELNTPAGIVDLRTGQIRPADPGALHTRSTRCAPDPGADPTIWLDFLATTFANNTELICYLQRLVGYSAIGHVGAHVLPFAYGSGGNGKGVFLEAVTGVLGDYASTAPVGFLMTQTHAGHETEIARLAGARMVVCSEVNEGDRFDEAKVKSLTGGDTLTARFMRQDHFSFRPSHQLWLMGNHKPEVRSGGRAFWRRLRLIPFLREVPEDKIVDDLQGMLIADHGPALLAWVIAGAVAYTASGLSDPDSVKAATAEYAKEQDSVARFVEDCCLLSPVKTRTADVREAYERWCSTEGETPISAKALSQSLRNRFGVEPEKGNRGQRFYSGICLIAEDVPLDEERYK